MYNAGGGGSYNIPFQGGPVGPGPPHGYGAVSHMPMDMGLGSKKPIGIFWDIENCSIPKGKSGSSVVSHIRNSFVLNRLNHREFEFLIACDVKNLNKDIQEDINRAGCVTIAHVSSTSKNAADEKLRECMKKFVDTHGHASPILVLISGDIDFVHDLRAYQTRLGCYVILLYGPSCSPQFKQGWNECYDFRTFCSAIVDITGLEKGFKKANLEQNKAEKKPQQKGSNGNVSGNVNLAQAQANPGQKGKPGNIPNPEGGQGKPGPKGKPGNIAPGNADNTQAKAGQKGKPSNDAPIAEGSAQAKPMDGQKQAKAKPNNTQLQQGQKLVNPQQANNPPSAKGPKNQKPGAETNQNQPKKQKAPLPPGPSRQAKMTLQTQAGPVPNPANAKQVPDKKEEFILMVAGLPGKLDFKILKEQLQEYAKEVKGLVKFVKNGQGFITFLKKEDADKAVELLASRPMFGKKLQVSFASSIPFENTTKNTNGPKEATASSTATTSSASNLQQAESETTEASSSSAKPKSKSRRKKRTQNISGGDEVEEAD